MTDPTDGLAIARQRIAEEALARTGTLDLGWLGLTGLPSELFDLTHLRVLNLGLWYYSDEDGAYRPATSCLGANRIASEIGRLAQLTNLVSLGLSGTDLGRLEGVVAIASLQFLHCGGTEVSDLTPLSGLTGLQDFLCYDTEVSDLTPLSGLTALQSLDCGETEVSDLTPLSGLTALQSLNCTETKVSDLTPLSGLTALEELDFSGCILTTVPSMLWHLPRLKHVVLYRTRLPGIPPEVLSQEWFDNCLDSLRAHLADLRAGVRRVPDVKVMVLGNGLIGKTQICRRLRGQGYDPSEESTHGVLVTSAPLADGAGGEAARLQVWDFGGQDLYHGTHALFLNNRAIVLLVWTPEAEAAAEQSHGGMVFRNRPLDWWLDCLRQFSGPDTPVILVQTRCDRIEDERWRPPVEDRRIEAFRFRKPVSYSARENRGRGALDDALGQAVAWLRQRDGEVMIGAGRLTVRRLLEGWRDRDALLPLAQRRYRTLSRAAFVAHCRAAGGVSSPDQLLAYLHQAGVVFYRPGLFEDRIILDQAWALDAIYAVFHREKCYRRLQRQRGRFTRSDLADWVWSDRKEEEQKLLLSMMESCGICFVHRRGSDPDGLEAEYIAPDLLPDARDIHDELERSWDDDRPVETAVFEYRLLSPTLMRGLIARIGGQAALAASYWRDGVQVYEASTRSRGRLQQERTEGWQGRLVVRTQRGEAGRLLDRLVALVEEEQRRIGLVPLSAPVSAGVRPEPVRSEPVRPESSLTFVQERAIEPEVYVSYAWGADREQAVDAFCAEAAQHGIAIIRDTTALTLGESLLKFMKRLGRGQKILVFLSDKYLKSVYCCYELFEIWRQSRQEDEDFLSRIVVFILPCAKIHDLSGITDYSMHWHERYREIDEKIKWVGNDDFLGDKGSQEFRQMKRYHRELADILKTVTGVLQPRDFEQFKDYALELLGAAAAGPAGQGPSA